MVFNTAQEAMVHKAKLKTCPEMGDLPLVDGNLKDGKWAHVANAFISAHLGINKNAAKVQQGCNVEWCKKLHNNIQFVRSKHSDLFIMNGDERWEKEDNY